MPIEHTLEFYERVELLRLEKKGDNFAPKLFNKVIYHSALVSLYNTDNPSRTGLEAL